MVSRIEEALASLEREGRGPLPFSLLDSRNAVAGRIKLAERALRLIAGEENHEVNWAKRADTWGLPAPEVKVEIYFYLSAASAFDVATPPKKIQTIIQIRRRPRNRRTPGGPKKRGARLPKKKGTHDCSMRAQEQDDGKYIAQLRYGHESREGSKEK